MKCDIVLRLQEIIGLEGVETMGEKVEKGEEQKRDEAKILQL